MDIVIEEPTTKKEESEGLSQSNVNSLLKEYGAKSEEDLAEKLYEESFKLPCVCCKKEYPIQVIVFEGGEPICLNCR